MDETVRPKALFKQWSSCTAVRIAGPLFLTAAHCLNPYPLRSTAPEKIYTLNTIVINHKFSATAGIKYYGGKCNAVNKDCYNLTAKAVIHPLYSGPNDWDYDLAVIYVVPKSQTSLRAEDDGWRTKYSWIASQKPVASQDLAVYGWGPVNNTDAKPAVWKERVVPGTTIPINTGSVQAGSNTEITTEAGKMVARITKYGRFSVTTTATKQYCRGDSGSPGYVDPNRVVGIFHGTTNMTQALCPGPGEAGFARADLVRGWIEPAVRRMQSGAATPIPNACSCGFVGAATDPYNSENPLARITCALGCTDPTLLQPLSP